MRNDTRVSYFLQTTKAYVPPTKVTDAKRYFAPGLSSLLRVSVGSLTFVCTAVVTCVKSISIKPFAAEEAKKNGVDQRSTRQHQVHTFFSCRVAEAKLLNFPFKRRSCQQRKLGGRRMDGVHA